MPTDQEIHDLSYALWEKDLFKRENSYYWEKAKVFLEKVEQTLDKFNLFLKTSDIENQQIHVRKSYKNKGLILKKRKKNYNWRYEGF